MQNYLIIKDEEVQSVIVWDGESLWSPPDGTTVELAPEGVGSKWRRIDGQWVAPERPQTPTANPERESAFAKLAALGLTEQEIAALLK